MSAFLERRFTAQDGLSLYFRDYGDPLAGATPVLCLPGLARNSKDFHRLAMHLCGTRRVLCPDYRGRGRSDYDPDPGNYRPATYLNDIRHLLAVTGIHHAVVIGTSMGGLLACAMGAAMPTVLAGVVMNDVGPDVNAEGIERILDYLSTDSPQPDWDSATAAFKNMLPTLSFRTDAEWREAAQATWRQGKDGQLHFDWDLRIIEPLRDPGPAPDLWALFRSLRRLPVLVIRGGISDVLSAATIERMAAAHPHLQRLCLEGVGHAPSLFEPEATAAIDGFVARL